MSAVIVERQVPTRRVWTALNAAQALYGRVPVGESPAVVLRHVRRTVALIITRRPEYCEYRQAARLLADCVPAHQFGEDVDVEPVVEAMAHALGRLRTHIDTIAGACSPTASRPVATAFCMLFGCERTTGGPEFVKEVYAHRDVVGNVLDTFDGWVSRVRAASAVVAESEGESPLPDSA